MYNPLGNSLGQSHCLGSSSVIDYALRDGVLLVRQSLVGKGGRANFSSLHILSSFGLICMLVSF